MIPLLLVFLGLILIFLEFFLPGAVLGTLGGIAVLSGIILFATQGTSLFMIILFIIGCIATTIMVIRFAIWRIVNAKPQYSIYSADNQAGYQASSFDANNIGKSGIVLSDLKPGGYILVSGKQQSAISISGYITKGSEIVVVGGQEQSLIVKIRKKEIGE